VARFRLLRTLGAVAGLVALQGCAREAEAAQPPPAEPTPEVPAATPPPGPPRRLFARKHVSRVRSAPTLEGRQLGYLRAGTVLTARTDKPVGFDRCRRGWYEIAEPPGGFVCDGREVTAFDGDTLPDRQPTRANRSAPLPYRYAYNRKGALPTPMYKRLPTEEEALVWEDGQVPPGDAGLPEEALAVGIGTDAGVAERGTLDELQGERGALVRRRLNPGFHVSLDREFDTAKRKYWRTMSNGYIPHGRMVEIAGSAFHGVEAPALPLAFVVASGVPTVREIPPGKLVPGPELPYHASFPIGEEREVKQRRYLVTPGGDLVRAEQVVRIERAPRPAGVGPDERWLDVDLTAQSLVAYVGDRPAYATLISTGRIRNERNPLANSATPTGTFRLLSKHVSATMDGDHALFGAYSLEDVPYVQFFQGAFAMHGAFWHDKFGKPASHGCINLAPGDARWLFDWTSPNVPVAWHAAYPVGNERGTVLVIRGTTPKG
jgi:lipoprotein-anchoring transpeptidase ErfK/SrfK